MTDKEQAIEYIKTYRKLDENLYNIAPKGTVSSYATKKCLEFWDMAIEALEAQPRWIPVGERLPEKDGEYLVYGKVVDENEDNQIFIGLYDEGSEGFGWWQDYYDNETLGFLDSDFTEYASILAWMPLPPCYEPQESEEEG